MSTAETRKLDSPGDCEDFVAGCLFMGTGGGGSPEDGLRLLTEALEDGLALGWVAPEAIEDRTLTAMLYEMGSIAPESDHGDDLARALHLRPGCASRQSPMAEAVRVLSEHLGEEIGCVVVAELGATNSPAPIVTAARLGISVVDGDYSGRAVPEEMQSTPYAYGVPSDPFVSVDRWGNTAVVTRTANPHMLERIGRHLAIAGISGTSIASTPIRADRMRRILVPGTLTRCLEIGRTCRLAVDRGDDPVDAALGVTDGWRLFDGVVTGKRWEDAGGFMFGTLEIAGTAGWTNHSMRVWFKNEIHVTWLDGQPWICSPDLVTLVDPDTGRGFTNTDIAVGDRVTAVGMRGLEVMRRADLLRTASGPEYFGFDIGYVPIEQLMDASRARRQV